MHAHAGPLAQEVEDTEGFGGDIVHRERASLGGEHVRSYQALGRPSMSVIEIILNMA